MQWRIVFAFRNYPAGVISGRDPGHFLACPIRRVCISGACFSFFLTERQRDQRELEAQLAELKRDDKTADADR